MSSVEDNIQNFCHLCFVGMKCVQKWVLYVKFKRSLPQNVTDVRTAQRVPLFYFLNLSRADFEPEDSPVFKSFSFLSFATFILSSTVSLITSCRANKSREMSHALQIQQKNPIYFLNVILYSWLLTLRSSWATFFLRFSTLPVELRPFFLNLGTNFSLASGSKPWEEKKQTWI